MKSAIILLVLMLSVVFISTANAELVGYWDFDDDTGTIATDSSTYSNDGALTGTADIPQWVSGKFGPGLHFSRGDEARVRVPHDSSLALIYYDSLTIMAWVYFDDLIGNQTIIRQDLGFQFNKRTDNRFEILGPYGELITSNATASVGQWIHVAVTIEPSNNNLVFYYSGVLDNTMPYTSTVGEGDYIDIGFLTGQEFNGIIDEVRIYNSALSQEEIVAAMNDSGEPIGEPPVADAGDDMVTAGGTTVMLDGSLSYDIEGTHLRYIWTRLPERTILYNGFNPTFETKALGRAEEVIELEVQDSDMNSDTDEIIIINHKTNIIP